MEVKQKRRAPAAPQTPHHKSQWPIGETYNVPVTQSFQQFAKENFVEGTPLKFVRKEIRKPLLVYTPEKEKDDVIKVWRVLVRLMGDTVDYRSNLEHATHQPELGSVMTRLCRQLGQHTSHNPFGPPPAQPGNLNIQDEDILTLPTNPKLGTLRKLKNTISLRLFGRGRKSVFQFLPLEETLITDLDKIQYIIGYAILRPRIRDELYCGICRQLIQNPYRESIQKGWVLLNLMAASFPPSERCVGSILQFFEDGPKIYAASAKKLLLKTIENGGRLHPPCVAEYMAVLKKTPLELEIHLMDGKTLSLASDGSTRAYELCKAVSNKLGMKSFFGFNIFITNRNKVSSLSGNDHILDSISQLEQISRDYQLKNEDSKWRLYFRKEIFEPWEDYQNDPVATNLIYAQLKRGVFLQELDFQNEEDLVEFLAKVLYIEKGAELDEEYLRKEIVIKYHQQISPHYSGPQDTGPNYSGPLDTGPNYSGPQDTGPGVDQYNDTLKINQNNNVSDLNLNPNTNDVNSEHIHQNDGISNGHPSMDNPNNHHDIESIDEALDHDLIDKISESFKTFFTSSSSNTQDTVKPNSYKVKLDIISYAKHQWKDTFSHVFDVTDVIATEQVLEGVLRISVHSRGVSLLREDDMVLREIGFVEITQLGEKINTDDLVPDSVVITLIDGDDLVVISQDAIDIRDMMSHLLLGLSERSKYAVAIAQYTSKAVDELDLEIGDLLILNRNKITVTMVETNPDPTAPNTTISSVECRNTRSGQVCNVAENMFHILPTTEPPEERILNTYKRRGKWTAE